jgi:hypothetical protein
MNNMGLSLLPKLAGVKVVGKVVVLAMVMPRRCEPLGTIPLKKAAPPWFVPHSRPGAVPVHDAIMPSRTKRPTDCAAIGDGNALDFQPVEVNKV